MLGRLTRRSCRSLYAAASAITSDSDAVRVENRVLDSTARRVSTDPVAATEVSRIEEGLEFEWKWDARCHVWNLMEAQDLALNPRPVHHRVPNFKGAEVAAVALSQLEIFQNATSIAISPNNALMKIRELALDHGKTLYIPRPGFKDGLFGRLTREAVTQRRIAEAVTSSRIHSFVTPLTDAAPFVVDLVVLGSVAVDAETGARVGSGEGYGDLEYGLLRTLGAATEDTPVVTAVHDAQLQERVPFGVSAPYDVPVDLVVTPTRLLYPQPPQPKPPGLLWAHLGPAQLTRCTALGVLKRRLEEEAGAKLPTGKDTFRAPSPRRQLSLQTSS